jgi:hypothetical protein
VVEYHQIAVGWCSTLPLTCQLEALWGASAVVQLRVSKITVMMETGAERVAMKCLTCLTRHHDCLKQNTRGPLLTKSCDLLL